VYVLDTDIVVDFLRGFSPAMSWFANVSDTDLTVPGFVAMELIQGCKNREDQSRVERLLRPYTVVWPSAAECNAALDTLSRFHLSHSLGILDSLIGHMAVALNAPLCTFNAKHYAVIPGLTMVRPYER
jgi:predicted nucleic acid-binding protein